MAEPSRVRALPRPKRIATALQRARAASVGSIVSGRESGLVKVTATAETGPAGPLVAPMSGQACVWYRSVLTPASGVYVNRLRAAPDAPSDVPARRTSWFGPGPTEQRSTAPFRLGDGRSALAIDPAAADVDSTILAVNEQRPLSERYPAGLWQEWIIPVGAPVLALGAVARDGATVGLCPADDGVLLVSTRDETQVLTRRAFGAGMTPRLAVVVAVGGVTMLVVVILVVVLLVMQS